MALPDPTSPHPHLQVQDALQALQEERDQVFEAWALKQERLQSMLQEQRLLRQCDQLAKILTAQEAGLTASTRTLILFHTSVPPFLPESLAFSWTWSLGAVGESSPVASVDHQGTMALTSTPRPDLALLLPSLDTGLRALSRIETADHLHCVGG